MCKVHCAALISEYLHMLEDRKLVPEDPGEARSSV